MSLYLRAVIIFVILAALAVLAWQLAQAPGEVSLVWHGWRIDTSASLLAVAVAATLALGAALYAVLHGIRILPRRLAQARERRRKEAGYHALTRGMVAIAAGDATEARRFAQRASELLGRPPGALGTHAVQIEGEYMYYGGSRQVGPRWNLPGLGPQDEWGSRQEGQFDIGLVNRWGRFQLGLFNSMKYVNFGNFQRGGTLGQGAATMDIIFGRGRFGWTVNGPVSARARVRVSWTGHLAVSDASDVTFQIRPPS